jgi:hypothetical protein
MGALMTLLASFALAGEIPGFSFQEARASAQAEASAPGKAADEDLCGNFNDPVEPDSRYIKFDLACDPRPHSIKHDSPYVTFDAEADKKKDEEARDNDLLSTAGQARGRTRGTMRTRMIPDWNGESVGDNDSRFWPLFTISLRLDNLMGISSDYPEGSPQYRETLAHEMLHWNDNIRVYRETVKWLKAEIVKRGLDKPVVVERRQAAVDKEQDRILFQFHHGDRKKVDDLVDKKPGEVAEILGEGNLILWAKYRFAVAVREWDARRHPLGYENEVGARMTSDQQQGSAK